MAEKNKTTYELTYTDARGDKITRIISNIAKISDSTFSAYCHLRNATRTFHGGGIEKILDTATGEILDVHSFGLTDTQSSKRGRSIKIDPVAFFEDWHFLVGNYHYSAFGITKREFVNKEQTVLIRLAPKHTTCSGS